MDEKNQDKKNITYLIFYAGEKLYAAESVIIKEIFSANEISKLPFTPDYVKGIINYYGKAYLAADFNLLQKKTAINSKLFIILNDENDLAIQISQVKEFYTVTSKKIKSLPLKNKNPYSLYCIDYMEKDNLIEIPLLDFKLIVKKIRSDFNNA